MLNLSGPISKIFNLKIWKFGAVKFVGYGKVGLPGIKFSLNRFHALTRGFGDTDSAGRTVLVPRAAHTLPVGADKTCKTKTWLKSKGFVIQQSPHWFMIIRFLNRYIYR